MNLPRFQSRVFLAPMAGVSDPAFRLLCKKMGAGLVTTELTSIHSIVARKKAVMSNPNSVADLVHSDAERPVSIQLFGSDLDALKTASKIVSCHFDLIDYNMGCPAPHITSQMAGAALLQKPSLVQKIFRTLVKSSSKPVTLKIRAGIGPDKTAFKDIAKLAQREGVQMITLHPRTVQQGYSGKADWGLIRELRELVDIPVVGNGDITSPEDAKLMIEQTGCDYVMIGRASMGNPFLIRQVKEYLDSGSYPQCTPQKRIDLFFAYLNLARHSIRFSNIKNQAIRFARGLPLASRLRAKLSVCQNMEQLKAVFEDAYIGAKMPLPRIET